MTSPASFIQLRKQTMFLRCLFADQPFLVSIRSEDYDELAAYVASKSEITVEHKDKPDATCFQYDGIWVCRYPIDEGAFKLSDIFRMLTEDALPMTVSHNLRDPFGKLVEVATHWNYTHGARP